MVSDNDLLTRSSARVTISLKKATDLDYIRELHESLEKPNRKVSEVMTSDVVTIAPDAILGHASRLMVDKHLKRLPVVSALGELVGIVGRAEMMRALLVASGAEKSL
ncbi:MAG TPA: CBS domain-containing protein [Candidatus Binataceae bacterium]|nr:CBS domain-containing protein [Candidatus Binataceae bacterium]